MTLRIQLKREYGLSVNRWERVRDVYRIRTREKGTLCLKGYGIPETEALFISSVLRHLRKKGFDRGPKIANTTDHRRWIRRDDALYMLTGWISGSHPDFAKRSELRKAFRTLAKFHRHAEGLPAHEAPAARIRYSQVDDRPLQYRSVLRECKGMSAYIEQCDRAAHYMNTAATQEAIRREELKGAFVHGDYNYPNLVKDPSGKLHLIDFDNTSMMPRMTDLSHIMHRNFPWQGGEIMRFVEVYDRTRPLGMEDRHLLHALLLLPYPLVRAIRQYSSSFRKKFDFPSSSQIARYQRVVKHLL